MPWSNRNMQWLSDRYSYRAIARETGIPYSTVRRVSRGESLLPSQHVLTLRRFRTRAVYRELREAGFSPSLARQYRWHSETHVQEFLTEAKDTVETLSRFRFDQYKAYLQREGRYSTDEDVMQRLRESIRKALAKSPIDLGRDEGQDSPTLRHML